MTYHHPFTENYPLAENEPWRAPFNHPFVNNLSEYDTEYHNRGCVASYLPEIMDAVQDEKHHILKSVIQVKALVVIIEEYDTPRFVLQYIMTKADPQISLPLVPEGQYDFTVDWGDGLYDRVTRHDQAEITHVYDGGGLKIVEERHQYEYGNETYEYFYHQFVVTLAGVVNGISFARGRDKPGVRRCHTIKQWGCARIDVPCKPLIKTRCQLRLEMRRRAVRRCLERKLRVEIHTEMAQYASTRNAYDRCVELSGYETPQYTHLSNMFTKWQPLGAEFKTNIQCNRANLYRLTRSATERRVQISFNFQ